ncbi:hypothetical protein TRFO_24944 [Tritrichomonas foetus]|uniref:Uncharacterized protein n=1 Tax=Tritrichomonas foetus TaxID=1144522 RepID=A0A1J4K7P7_9EUKA|nr:hypothetical protein TRFO_24944 [Tritrichomonas foetus]|eukprot:OHT06912.1 hypothetical protein TRFO_24944 [Tritrichomonas foetus]
MNIFITDHMSDNSDNMSVIDHNLLRSMYDHGTGKKLDHSTHRSPKIINYKSDQKFDFLNSRYLKTTPLKSRNENSSINSKNKPYTLPKAKDYYSNDQYRDNSLEREQNFNPHSTTQMTNSIRRKRFSESSDDENDNFDVKSDFKNIERKRESQNKPKNLYESVFKPIIQEMCDLIGVSFEEIDESSNKSDSDKFNHHNYHKDDQRKNVKKIANSMLELIESS